MIFGILYTILLLFFWMQYGNNKTKDAVKISFVVGLIVVWLTFLFMNLGDWKEPKNGFLFLLIIPIIILILRQVYKSADVNHIEIVAKQQSYWDISPSKIYNFYKNRKIKKDDRIETKVNLGEKFLTKKYSNSDSFLSGNVIYEIKNLKLTKVENLSELKNYNLYKIIFSKIEKMIKYLEKQVDFEKVLKENDMCFEYFLMDLWETYTKSFNIGTANLEVYASRDIEKELVGALDNIDLNSVKRKGAALFYSYMKFKNRA